MNTKVFIVNKGGHDFSGAETYGELVYLSEGSLNRYAVTNMYRKFAEVLKHSTKSDYILLTGLTTMSAIACSIFGYLHGRLNILIFKQGHYVDRSILLGELLDSPFTSFEEKDEEERIDNIMQSTGLSLKDMESSVNRIREYNEEKEESN